MVRYYCVRVDNLDTVILQEVFYRFIRLLLGRAVALGSAGESNTKSSGNVPRSLVLRQRR